MEKKLCKYCGKELERVLFPPDSDWGVEYLLVCLNDECPYYIRGWDWMQTNYQVQRSYRYFYNPFYKNEGPLSVTSKDEYKDKVVKKIGVKES